jgi:hypothetical protein
MRAKLVNALPEPLIGALRNTRDSLVLASRWPESQFHPWRRDSIRKLNAMRNTHPGERCFIIGNGPSLRNTDLSKLKNEFTIGMNRIYLNFAEMGYKTSVLLTVNDLVIEQCSEDIRALPIPTFVSWRGRRWINPADNLHYLYTSYELPTFNGNVAGRLWEGATVTYVAMQLAFHLGFKQVILIGVDHSFTTQGKPNSTIVSTGDDPNHFNPSYFGKGFRWQLPDLETSELAYKMASKAYKKNGREIIDATVGGKLTVFPKANFEDLF